MRSISFALIALLALSITAGGNAWAQNWPSKPLNVFSAFPPGNNDFIIRLVDGPFQASFKQPLVIKHRPGAGGNIGAETVVRAAPDGHTLLVTVDTVATVNPRLYPNLKFKADAYLVPVIYLANTAQTLVFHSCAVQRPLESRIWRFESRLKPRLQPCVPSAFVTAFGGGFNRPKQRIR